MSKLLAVKPPNSARTQLSAKMYGVDAICLSLPPLSETKSNFPKPNEYIEIVTNKGNENLVSAET